MFVRNIAYDTTSEDVKEFFEKYGKVNDVKMVKQGEGHKGSGFVKFEEDATAQQVAEISTSYWSKNNKIKDTTIKRLEKELDLNGRKIVVLLAMSQ